MRTNIILNEELLREAQQYSSTKTRSALVEEALRILVQVRARERAAENYASRVRQVQQKLQNRQFRDSAAEILKRDRSRS